jgi:hypothetical protein
MFEYIQKVTTPVRACMAGEAARTGNLALLPQAPNHDGPETILELLNSKQRFIPLVVPMRSEVILLNRRLLNWVMAGPDVATDLVCPSTYMVTHEEVAHITFHDGSTVPGLMQMEQPQGMNRVSDYLNLDEDFFAMRAATGFMLVNKARIRGVRLVAPSPAPMTIQDVHSG